MSFKASESCSAAAPNGSSANEAWQPMLFVSLPLDCSLLNGKTGRSEKTPTTGTHTYFLCAVESRGLFSVGSACTISKQLALAAAAIPVISWMALEEMKGKECQGGLQVLI